ncbi:DUF2634 domain-containing protein [Halalkalibacterium halodurans]|uniref:Phage portal protein n=1 Tax=Halalkalibacterium halodurans TaxID=86665 RepID=A0A0M0KM36_ALKHA|nr:DUF2634 domain-containing protein [Halalkalibacterium halodurans]TPE70676.1 DUF2634 domain-containing protein [Halalkalibacterium halodurans]
MLLSPEIQFEEEDDNLDEEIETSSTWLIDFESGRILNQRVDGLRAIEQFVYMSLMTERYAYPIYSHDVGSELQELLSDPETTDAYKEMEIPRLITEALEYDERIAAVTDIEIEKQGDAFRVSFIVESEEGTLEMEEMLNAT